MLNEDVTQDGGHANTTGSIEAPIGNLVINQQLPMLWGFITTLCLTENSGSLLGFEPTSIKAKYH